MEEIKKYKGKVAFLFLMVRPIKNPIVWDNFFNGYQDYFNIYTHISGNDYDKGPEYWPKLLWDNRVETHGIKHTATAWGTVSLVIAEGLLYKAALKNKQNKYSGKGDQDIFKECFPERFIPSTNSARTRAERDARKIILRTTHQWKVLVRREAKEFVKMTQNKQYMNSYDKCFTFDPERLAPDEYAFANWLILRHGREYLKKHIIDVETTFVDFDKKAIHAMEFKKITRGMRRTVCEEKEHGYPFFARKFPPDANIIKDVPVKCKSDKRRRQSRRSNRRRRSRHSR